MVLGEGSALSQGWQLLLHVASEMKGLPVTLTASRLAPKLLHQTSEGALYSGIPSTWTSSFQNIRFGFQV